MNFKHVRHSLFPLTLSALAVFISCLLLTGCEEPPAPEQPQEPIRIQVSLPEEFPEPETAVMVRVGPEDAPEFLDDMGYEGLAQAMDRSLAYLRKLPEDRMFVFGKDSYNRDHIIESLERFLAFIESKPSAEELGQFLAAHYRVYRSVGGVESGQVLFTGYYEPLMTGSRVRSEKFAWPVYKRPDDLVSVDLSLFSDDLEGKRIVGRVSSQSLVPYHDRAAIDFEGAVDGKATAIAWVADPVDLFFLHIQGSGKIALEDGTTLNVHYDTSNGRAYRSIGKALIESGKISKEKMSMQAIREYIAGHPGEAEEILGGNPSYVFFRTEEGGPYGCLGAALTTGRSLAVDRSIFPMAGLVFVQTSRPVAGEDGAILGWEDCTRFMLNQDTGGAIKGPGRADIFWGAGPYAELAAGHLKNEGSLFFLVLAPTADDAPAPAS